MTEPQPYRASVGFNVNFTHSSLGDFAHLTPAQEYAIRELYFQALLGSNPAGFAALCARKWDVSGEPANGHLGGSEAHRIAELATGAYNDLKTGTTLKLPSEDPHCVRWEWIDGKLCTIYNYLAPVESCTECPPPGGTYHVIVCNEAPLP